MMRGILKLYDTDISGWLKAIKKLIRETVRSCFLLLCVCDMCQSALTRHRPRSVSREKKNLGPSLAQKRLVGTGRTVLSDLEKHPEVSERRSRCDSTLDLIVVKEDVAPSGD